MNAFAGIKLMVGWGDSSATSRFWEKLVGLLAGLGLAGTTMTKEIFTRTSAADVDRYLIEIQNYFLVNCEPLDNNRSRIICSGAVPQVPSVDNPTTENILTGVSTCFQAAIMLILIRGLVRTYSRREGSSNDFVPSPVSYPAATEDTNLLGDTDTRIDLYPPDD